MSKKRFEVIEKQGNFELMKVIRDNETGVLYLLHQAGYGAGLTVLVDPKGKPLIDEAFQK